MEKIKEIKKFDIPSIDKALENGKTEINLSSKGLLLDGSEVSNFFLKLLTETYYNESEMTLIKNSNDCLNQAPVLTWILLKKEEIEKNNMGEELKKNKGLKIAIGAFWGMVMKEKYNMSKGSKQTFTNHEKIFNFRTASRYK